MRPLNEVDMEAWVQQAPDKPQRGFREAVHIILESIGRSQHLHARMVMKGGLLMAIRYDSSRYTRDIDFSTTAPYVAVEAQELITDLEQHLGAAADRLPYATACRVQSSKIEPRGENKTHQTLALKIGYADMGSESAMKRLLARNSAQVVEIDYSYNEVVFGVEVLQLDGGTTIQSYSLHNIVAEKLRSLLQQPVRRRNRRQDVYDVCLLLDSSDLANALGAPELASIHHMLMDSCRSKGIEPGPLSMDDEAVVRMARQGYEGLKDDVAGDLPDFEAAMARVQGLYRSLPWQ
ncbi:nucleotidyl transferase AbiEii/AbiGii toxin family protein [Hydrogenophaga laconesensis]|uniref:Nucleotidyltransferase component of viral defense system n=1 Tax=Hydrogenophaga laconesensis TaxID=1805971 RepID=A0ABU1VJT0_9BURK|nr:nucleotidyl transferase AbiEii/AbiGii toxin family protein [Hydrogenophaga laconesensis]MDP3172669.1 nucleotidyl transferase AbiEii/AbiGii toxin family protein [Polaromonas sp.]MDR7097590.1 putative nucleotidyltransferase component of viral defense system [Hydrogenophaga laconesensis]